MRYLFSKCWSNWIHCDDETLPGFRENTNDILTSAKRRKWQFVGNKAKGRISKRVLQENKAPNFPENEHFLPSDTHTYVCVLGGKKCLLFGKFGVVYFLATTVFRFTFLPYSNKFRVMALTIRCIRLQNCRKHLTKSLQQMGHNVLKS